MKLIGAIFLISATSFVGFDLSKKFSLRTKQIRMFIYSLQMIEAEMTYSNHSLRQIFIQVKQKTEGPVAHFYERLANHLQKPVTQFSTLWDEELSKLKQYSAFNESEMNILQQFGKNMGNHTIEQQIKQIKLTTYYLQKQLDEAIEQKNKYDRTVKSLGFLIGLLIVLILI
jgi:stage III sporulation protein AB